MNLLLGFLLLWGDISEGPIYQFKKAMNDIVEERTIPLGKILRTFFAFLASLTTRVYVVVAKSILNLKVEPSLLTRHSVINNMNKKWCVLGKL